jgi:hypothetical protein
MTHLKVHARIGGHDIGGSHSPKDGWQEVEVTIQVPDNLNQPHESEDETLAY